MWTVRSTYIRVSICSRKIISPRLPDPVHAGVKAQPYPNLQKKMGEFMRRRQAIATPYASAPSRAKPQKRPRRKLIKLTTTPDRRLAKPQRVNLDRNQTTCRRSPLPRPAVNNKNRTINWTTSAGKNLMQDTLEVVQDVSTTLTPVQGTQLVRTFLPSPSNY